MLFSFVNLLIKEPKENLKCGLTKKKKWPPHAKVKNQVAEQYGLLLLVCLKVHMYKCIEKQPIFTSMVNGGLLWKVESGIEDKDFIFFSTVSFIAKIY